MFDMARYVCPTLTCSAPAEKDSAAVHHACLSVSWFESKNPPKLTSSSSPRLAAKARYFSRAYEGPFVEAQTKTIVFDDILIQDFRNFGHWISNGRLPLLSLENLIHLYVLADRFDARDLRETITDELSQLCFSRDFIVPSSSTIAYLDDNVPKSYPLQSLLANAVARIAYHSPIDLPCPFSDTVAEVLDKPYGICQECYLESISLGQGPPSECAHFFDEPADYKPERYREASHF